MWEYDLLQVLHDLRRQWCFDGQACLPFVSLRSVRIACVESKKSKCDLCVSHAHMEPNILVEVHLHFLKTLHDSIHMRLHDASAI